MKRAKLILVVDDERGVAEVTSKLLQAAGFKSVWASSAKECSDIWQKRRDEIAVLLTDCMMPDISGADLGAQLLQEKPTVKVIFMTGGSLGPIELALPVTNYANFIRKPFGLTQIVALIEDALAIDQGGQIRGLNSIKS